MILKFEQYNEGLTDKMTPKSDEDVKSAIDKYIEEVKEAVQKAKDDEEQIEAYVDIRDVLNTLMKIKGLNLTELIVELIEKDIISVNEIINDYIETFNYDDGMYEEVLFDILNIMK